jgi:hypothetical protein|nr:MAG TPA: hypothetical protein [Caudoviricetes sp.]
MEKQVAVTKENRDFLAKAFNVTPQMVWLSLTYQKDTELARRIRSLAIKRGGVIVNTLPECETIHDADGYMRQYFPNGALVECNKKTGHVDIIWQGTAIHGFNNVTISELYSIQDMAQKLSVKG